MRSLLALIVLLAGCTNAPAQSSLGLTPLPPLLPSRCAASPWTSEYDMQFYLASQHYLSPERRHLWCILKAQAIAESSLRPDAESPAGAAGLTQFLKATFDECVRKAGLAPGSSRMDPDAAIRCQAWYIDRLMDAWLAPRTQGCRIRLAAASYNSGLGNVITAQKYSGGAPCWPEISQYQHLVTGHHSEETINYVARIEREHTSLSGRVLED